MAEVVIALGSNLTGNWGAPEQGLRRAVKELSAAGISAIQCSPFYITAPVGVGLQSRYYNIVLVGVTSLSPNQLLKRIKSIEKFAGRGFGPHWGARVLDIDILDYHGWVLGWPPAERHRTAINRGRRKRGSLILPHPQAHLRDFVLYPLRDVCPFWYHRALRLPLTRLIARLPAGPRPVRAVFYQGQDGLPTDVTDGSRADAAGMRSLDADVAAGAT